MITGTFDSKTGIYEFNGKHYKPKWYANSITNSNVLSIYNTCIAGYDNGTPTKWPKAVLVTWKKRWEEAIKPSYPGLYAQSQLHYFDNTIQMGNVPTWAAAWKQSGFALIHEYEPGKVAWLRDEAKFANDIYIFFVDSVDPIDIPDAGNPGSTTGDITSGFIHMKCPNCNKVIF